jgi:hypothetical protein
VNEDEHRVLTGLDGAYFNSCKKVQKSSPPASPCVANPAWQETFFRRTPLQADESNPGYMRRFPLFSPVPPYSPNSELGVQERFLRQNNNSSSKQK